MLLHFRGRAGSSCTPGGLFSHPSFHRGFWSLLLLFLLLPIPFTSAQNSKSYRVQVGTFTRSGQALALVEKVKRVTARPVYADYLGEEFIVTAGEFENPAPARQFEQELSREGYSDAFAVEVLKSIQEKKTVYPIHHIQIDNYTTMDKAEEVAEQLRKKNYHPVETLDQGSYYTVRLGQYQDLDKAEETMQELRRSGYPYCWLVQTSRTRTRTETNIFAIRPLDKVSAQGARIDPDQLAEGQLVQVVVGPFQQQGVARDTFNILEVEKFLPLRLVRTEQALEIEVKEPREYQFARRLVEDIESKGFDQVMIRETMPVQILEEKLKPGTEEDIQDTQTPVARPAEPTAEEKAREKIVQAQQLLDNGQIQQARDHFAIALGTDPNNENAIEGMAETRRLLEQQKELEKRLTEARYLVKNDELERAVVMYEQITEEFPDNNTARRELNALRDEIAKTPVTATTEITSDKQEQTRPQADKPKSEAEKGTARSTGKTGAMPWSWIGIALIAIGGIGALVFVKKKQAGAKAAPGPASPSEPAEGAPPSAVSPIAETAPEEKSTKTLETSLYPASGPEESAPEISLAEPGRATPPESLYTQPVEEETIEAPQVEPSSAESIYEDKVEDEFEPPQEPAGKDIPPETAPEPSREEEEEAPGIVFERNYEDHQDGSTPLDWQGFYENSKLMVDHGPDIPQPKACLKFVKFPAEEEVLFCAMLPESGRNPVFEFNMACQETAYGPIGIYLESVENEAISIGAEFLPGQEPGSIRLQLGSFTVNTHKGQWHLLKIEARLEEGKYALSLDGKILDEALPFPAAVENLDILCLKAPPETQAVLLLDSVRVFRT
jgi:tetratricopeptide (TPR) repeat protein